MNAMEPTPRIQGESPATAPRQQLSLSNYHPVSRQLTEILPQADEPSTTKIKYNLQLTEDLQSICLTIVSNSVLVSRAGIRSSRTQLSLDSILTDWDKRWG